MKAQTYKENDVVVLDDNSTATIKGYSKGWYAADDGRRFRAKRIVGMADAMEEAEGRRMAQILRKYAQTYEPSISASGRKSLNSGDDVAHLLAGMEPVQTIQVAERVLGMEAGTLLARYEHLNRGQQRMNAGNRIRAAIKRGDITIDDLKKAMKAA